MYARTECSALREARSLLRVLQAHIATKVSVNPAPKATTVFLAILLCVRQAITTIKLAKLHAASALQVITARQVPQRLHNAQAERTTNLQHKHLFRAA